MLNDNPAAVQESKEFLRERILIAAAATHVTLSAAEVAMLTYSEPSATAEERELALQVETDIGDEVYESKIVELIRFAYREDTAQGLKREWKRHLHILRNEDLYVLIMAERAGVAKGVGVWSGFFSVDAICLFGLGGAGFAFFFTPIGNSVRLSDAARIVLFLAWIAGLWMIGEWSRRRIGRS